MSSRQKKKAAHRWPSTPASMSGSTSTTVLPPRQRFPEEDVRRSGVLFLVVGAVFTAIFWRTHVLSFEIFDAPLGGCSGAAMAMGVLSIGWSYHAARRRARGQDPTTNDLLERIGDWQVRAYQRRHQRKARFDALGPWTACGLIALGVGGFLGVVDEAVERHVGWQETTCNVQAIAGTDQVRATYTEGFKTLSFEAPAQGASTTCYIRPHRKYAGEGTFTRPTGSRMPRTSDTDHLIGIFLVVGVVLLAVGRLRRRATSPKRAVSVTTSA